MLKSEIADLPLEDSQIVLKKNRYYEDYYNGYRLQNYCYLIVRKQDQKQVGFCELRQGDEEGLWYLGHIGYNVFPHHRGHRYATLAATLLLDLAQKLGMKRVLLTCNTDNIASIKTIEALPQCRLLQEVSVPSDEPLFHQGDYFKYIYEVKIKENENG